MSKTDVMSPLAFVLSKRPSLDLTGRVPREQRTVVGCGGFADIYRSTLDRDGQTLEVVLKSIRASLKDERRFVKVRGQSTAQSSWLT